MRRCISNAIIAGEQGESTGSHRDARGRDRAGSTVGPGQTWGHTRQRDSRERRPRCGNTEAGVIHHRAGGGDRRAPSRRRALQPKRRQRAGLSLIATYLPRISKVNSYLLASSSELIGLGTVR